MSEELASKKILITGSGGFIGRHLHNAIPHAEGLDAVPSPTTDIIADILSPTVNPAKYDIIYHLAALIGSDKGVKNPAETYRINICGTLNLLRNFKGLFIFLSTAGVYEPLKNPYFLSKYVSEEAVKTAQCKHIIFRLANPYGEGSKSVIQKWLDADRIQIYGDGTQTRDFVYIEDVIDVLTKPFKHHANKTYNVGTGKLVTLNELAALIVQLTGEKEIEHLPARDFEIHEPTMKPDMICKTTLRDGLLKCLEKKAT